LAGAVVGGVVRGAGGRCGWGAGLGGVVVGSGAVCGGCIVVFFVRRAVGGWAWVRGGGGWLVVVVFGLRSLWGRLAVFGVWGSARWGGGGVVWSGDAGVVA